MLVSTGLKNNGPDMLNILMVTAKILVKTNKKNVFNYTIVRNKNDVLIINLHQLHVKNIQHDAHTHVKM